MRTLLLVVAIPFGLAASSADECFARRGDRSPEAIEAMAHALEIPAVRSCAAENLRIAGAIEPLRKALASKLPETRAAAATALGTFRRDDLIDELAAVAADENLLVASNGFGALANYEDAAVVPVLERLARRGGIIGDLALERLMKIAPGEALASARELLKSAQVPDRLYALRVLADLGDRSDLDALDKIAQEGDEKLESRSRGFGFMPSISLSRAARVASESVRSR